MSSIFAIELCLRFEPSMHQHLQRIAAIRQGLDFGGKWEAYRSAADCLLHYQALIERGCWDFFDGTAKAEGDFRMWAGGLLSREGARREPSGMGDPFRGEPRYLAFTMACLLVDNTESQTRMARICNIPQGQLWHRQTFAHVLFNMRAINFACVEKDTMYLIPKEPNWALTMGDLSQEKFAYLRPVI